MTFMSILSTRLGLDRASRLGLGGAGTNERWGGKHTASMPKYLFAYLRQDGRAVCVVMVECAIADAL